MYTAILAIITTITITIIMTKIIFKMIIEEVQRPECKVERNSATRT